MYSVHFSLTEHGVYISTTLVWLCVCMCMCGAGNVFERSVVEQWIEVHGKICPLTGAPLCMTDLHEMPQLGDEIRKFLFQSATSVSAAPFAGAQKAAAVTGGSASSSATKPASSDDLYDF